MVKEVASVADEKNQDTTTNMFIFNKQNNEKVSNNQPRQGVLASLKVQNLMFFRYILLRYTVLKINSHGYCHLNKAEDPDLTQQYKQQS